MILDDTYDVLIMRRHSGIPREHERIARDDLTTERLHYYGIYETADTARAAFDGGDTRFVHVDARGRESACWLVRSVHRPPPPKPPPYDHEVATMRIVFNFYGVEVGLRGSVAVIADLMHAVVERDEDSVHRPPTPKTQDAVADLTRAILSATSRRLEHHQVPEHILRDVLGAVEEALDQELRYLIAPRCEACGGNGRKFFHGDGAPGPRCPACAGSGQQRPPDG